MGELQPLYESAWIVFENLPVGSSADARAGDVRGELLQYRAASGFGDQSCAICLGDENADVVELCCGGRHRFHRQCVVGWLATAASVRCPCCRRTPRCLPHVDGTSVFESSPEPSRADVRHGTTAQVVGAYGVFESHPTPSPADVRCAEEGVSVPVPRLVSGVFENCPAVSVADAGQATGRPCRSPARKPLGTVFRGISVFESYPAPSLADAQHTVASHPLTQFGCPSRPWPRVLHRLKAPGSWIRGR